MDFVKKNKIIVGIVVAVLVVAIASLLVLMKGSSDTSGTPSGNQTQNVKSVKPEDIGLVLTLKPDKKSVDMDITKLDGIKTIEYEVDYNAQASGAPADSEDGDTGATGDVPRGVVGSPIDVAGQSSINRNIVLGTCSSGTCKYDKVTGDIKFIIKVTYTNGEVGSVQESVPFN